MKNSPSIRSFRPSHRNRLFLRKTSLASLALSSPRLPLLPTNSIKLPPQSTEYFLKSKTHHSSKSDQDDLFQFKSHIHQNSIFEVKFQQRHSQNLPESRLFVGDIKGASNLSLILKHNIKSILSLGVSNNPIEFPGVAYLTVPIEHNDKQSISKYLTVVTKFIDSHKFRGNVLIHCYFGIYRSLAVCAAYLNKSLNMKMKDCIQVVKKSRPDAWLAMEFLQKLPEQRRSLVYK